MVDIFPDGFNWQWVSTGCRIDNYDQVLWRHMASLSHSVLIPRRIMDDATCAWSFLSDPCYWQSPRFNKKNDLFHNRNQHKLRRAVVLCVLSVSDHFSNRNRSELIWDFPLNMNYNRNTIHGWRSVDRIIAKSFGPFNTAVRKVSLWLHRGRDKWTPFRRRHFQMYFLEWKCLNSD